MRKLTQSTLLMFFTILSYSSIGQTSPALSSWLQNTTKTGTYYVKGNSTAIGNNVLVNCQQISYDDDWVYVKTTGMPAYTTGPFQDGNPSQAEDQNTIFKIPLNPIENTGTKTATTAGNIGIFVNGVALFDYRDGVAWDLSSNSLCGGPGNPSCPGGPKATMDWNRDAIVAEREGFDCSKGHPSQGNYHHHQNPSAFKLDLKVLSDVCNLYDADGLYTINVSQHSPLIGYAYDGFPIYGAYGYAKKDGSGGIVRIKSSYQLRTSMTKRTNGPDVNDSYPLGYFREDYEFVSNTDESYLDEHNGRFCVTPEYPSGTYCYFATVDENHNSAYPYAVGPTFYGVKNTSTVTTVPSIAKTYTTDNVNSLSESEVNKLSVEVFSTSDVIAVQFDGLVSSDFEIALYDINGQFMKKTTINKGQTIAYFKVESLYSGVYVVKISNNTYYKSLKVPVKK